jgi:FkbH-like protein
MKHFNEIKRNLKKDFSSFKTVKIALLGDTSTQFLNQALRGLAYDYHLNIDIFEADFNQIELQLLNTDSEVYQFKADYVIIFYASHKLLNKFYKTNLEARTAFADDKINQLQEICNTINQHLTTKIILYNFPEIDDQIFGNYANKITSSWLYQQRKLNLELTALSASIGNLFICDLVSLQNQIGKSNMFRPSVYVNSEMVLNMEALPEVAARALSIINANDGKIKKCLILDLDNTTWGGIIGDDGIENIQIGGLGIGKAFSELQYWAKELKNRGIILAVCSKNTESIAKEPFEKHPDMVLRLEDIAVFVANWENKAANIKHIQSILNIGFDSMVFLDDNPFERNMVREHIPAITVPELPEDPAEYLEYLYTLNLFETVSFSELDAERTKQYQVEAQRVQLQQNFVNEDDFLVSLNMVSKIEPFTKFNTPRVAQLSQRSNQFNLRTVRYNEAAIAQIGLDENYASFSFTLEDKFGDNGLICVIILEKISKEIFFIDTWFMSCRVLKRGMENFVLNTIVSFAKNNGASLLKGEYIHTPKNDMVKDHYKNLGFEEQENHWFLNLTVYKPKKTFIQIK